MWDDMRDVSMHSYSMSWEQMMFCGSQGLFDMHNFVDGEWLKFTPSIVYANCYGCIFFAPQGPPGALTRGLWIRVSLRQHFYLDAKCVEGQHFYLDAKYKFQCPIPFSSQRLCMWMRFEWFICTFMMRLRFPPFSRMRGMSLQTLWIWLWILLRHFSCQSKLSKRFYN